MGRFETNESHPNRWHQPVRVPQNKGGVFGSAKEMVDDLPGWDLQSVDEDACTITVKKKGGFLGGEATIVVRVEGPDDMPNSATHCSSESSGGLLSKDKANVAEFTKKFYMRIT
ncbi:MAG: hypothetical protein O2816_10855 [Planctomycetota bacterium]|nr:hypothetical protein [Planctomycetota bacterium]